MILFSPYVLYLYKVKNSSLFLQEEGESQISLIQLKNEVFNGCTIKKWRSNVSHLFCLFFLLYNSIFFLFLHNSNSSSFLICFLDFLFVFFTLFCNVILPVLYWACPFKIIVSFNIPLLLILENTFAISS